jgi:hypothetical protein
MRFRFTIRDLLWLVSRGEPRNFIVEGRNRKNSRNGGETTGAARAAKVHRLSIATIR